MFNVKESFPAGFVPCDLKRPPSLPANYFKLNCGFALDGDARGKRGRRGIFLSAEDVVDSRLPPSLPEIYSLLTGLFRNNAAEP